MGVALGGDSLLCNLLQEMGVFSLWGGNPDQKLIGYAHHHLCLAPAAGTQTHICAYGHDGASHSQPLQA